MKKLMILLVSLFAIQGLAKADNERPVEVKDLPKKAITFINEHFSDAKVSYAKIEEDMWEKKYDVVFVNGQKLEFDKNGEWTDVDCKNGIVPAAILPKPIKDYLGKTFPEQKVTKIERDKKGYEVKLNNKLEVKFDKKFNVIGLDD